MCPEGQPLIGKPLRLAIFDIDGTLRRGRVACTIALLMPQRPLVDYAVHWMERKRG
jgi:hypothetical protein